MSLRVTTKRPVIFPDLARQLIERRMNLRLTQKQAAKAAGMGYGSYVLAEAGIIRGKQSDLVRMWLKRKAKEPVSA